MSETIRNYNFLSKTAEENSDFTFTNPDGSTGLGDTSRQWNWCNDGVYTDCSSPTKKNDKFKMISGVCDLSKNYLNIGFSYSLDSGGQSIQLTVRGFNGDKLKDVYSVDVGSTLTGKQVLEISFEDYNNDDFYYEIEVKPMVSKKLYECDVIINNLFVATTSKETDDVIEYFVQKGVDRPKRFKNSFDCKHKTKEEIQEIIGEVGTNIGSYDTTNYPDGVVIIESDQKVHVITRGK